MHTVSYLYNHMIKIYLDFADISKTDTHGWLEGHLKEQNYGADWGDFASFSRHMQHMAGNLGVDLLLVDTGNSLECLIFGQKLTD